MSKNEKEYKKLYGRDWRNIFLIEAQTIALAGCGEKDCLRKERKLCDSCNSQVLRLALTK